MIIMKVFKRIETLQFDNAVLFSIFQVRSLDLSRTSANTGFVDALTLVPILSGPDGDSPAAPEPELLKIEELILSDCFYLVESDIRRILMSFPKLKTFRAGKVRGVTDISLLTASGGELTDVSVNGCAGVTSTAIADLISRNPNLMSLNIGDCGNTLSADFFPSSAPLRYLANLDISGAKLSEPDMKIVISRSVC